MINATHSSPFIASALALKSLAVSASDATGNPTPDINVQSVDANVVSPVSEIAPIENNLSNLANSGHTPSTLGLTTIIAKASESVAFINTQTLHANNAFKAAESLVHISIRPHDKFGFSLLV